jgi:hypothetical protein
MLWKTCNISAWQIKDRNEPIEIEITDCNAAGLVSRIEVHFCCTFVSLCHALLF